MAKGSSAKQSDELRHILSILRKWGIDTLGQLARLDQEELNARLGPLAVQLWERANGQSIRLLKLVRPVETFAESFEFETEVETLEPLLFILRRFLEQLTRRLAAIYLVATELTLRIDFSNKQHYRRGFKIPHPTNDVDVLFRMLHTHLENFKSEHPIVAVSLDAKPSQPTRQQFRFFETALRDPAQLSETLARLIGLLGADRVGTPLIEETHRPDAFRLEPFEWNSNINETNTDSPHPTLSLRERRTCESTAVREISRAALRRFRSKPSAAVLLERNKPVHVRSSEMSGPATAQSGPYLASGNWWDETAWMRAEWDLQLANGALLRCHQNPNGWQVDGIYD
jgi:protein ImuB